MEKSTLFLLSLFIIPCLAFIHPDKWELFIEKENISTAAVVRWHYRECFYTITDKGVFTNSDTGSILIGNSTNAIQPKELQKTTHMVVNKSDWGPYELYASGEGKLFHCSFLDPTGGFWREINTPSPINVKEMILHNNDLLLLTQEHELFMAYNAELSPVTLPKSLTSHFESVVPIAIGQEQITIDNFEGTNRWVLFRCQKGINRVYHILSYPFRDSVSQPFTHPINEESNIAYGYDCYYRHITVSSYNDTITLETARGNQESKKIRKLCFSKGTVIRDLGLFDRDIPTSKPNRLEYYTPVILLVATSRGSYALGIEEIIHGSEPLIITDELDSAFCVYDSVPSSKILYTKTETMQSAQFVLNDKGFAFYQAPLPSSVVNSDGTTPTPSMQLTTTNNAISLSLKEKQSGTLSLLTLKGQKLSAVNFVNSNKVLLSTANNFAKGVYLLKLQTKSGVVTEKLRVE